MSSVELARGRRGSVSHLSSRSRRAVNQVAAQDCRLEARETLPESPYRLLDKDLPPESSQIGTPWPPTPPIDSPFPPKLESLHTVLASSEKPHLHPTTQP